MSLNIIFAGTPFFASEILAALLESEHTLKAVLTQPDRPSGRGQAMEYSPVKTCALQHNLPVFQPTHLKDKAFEDTLAAYQPDVIVVVAYGLIVPQNLLDLPRFGCINVHASLLPRWRGAAPIQHAILAGDSETGVTIMQMDKGLDTGDMLKKVSFPLTAQETSQSLLEKMIPYAKKALLETLSDLEHNRSQPQKQDNNQANYAGKILKLDAKIDWNTPAIEIERKIRAFTPWPIAFCELDSEMIRIHQAEMSDHISNATPGTLLSATDSGIEVATQKGTLRLLKLQLPNRKCLPVNEILHGKRDFFTPGKLFS